MITRMILVSVPKERAAEAERLWKQECAPLMIKQPGCLSEQFLTGSRESGRVHFSEHLGRPGRHRQVSGQ